MNISRFKSTYLCHCHCHSPHSGKKEMSKVSWIAEACIVTSFTVPRSNSLADAFLFKVTCRTYSSTHIKCILLCSCQGILLGSWAIAYWPKSKEQKEHLYNILDPSFGSGHTFHVNQWDFCQFYNYKYDGSKKQQYTSPQQAAFILVAQTVWELLEVNT